MAIHLAAFFENQDGAGTLQNLAALADPLTNVVRTTGDEMRVPGAFPLIAGVYAGLDNTVEPRCQLVAPSFRETYRRRAFEIPWVSGAVEPGSPQVWADFRNAPIRAKEAEAITCETINNPASDTDQFVVLWWTDAPIRSVDPAGGHWIRATTAASALTANTWGNRALTFDETLDAGTYEVLGMRAQSTSLIAARLSFGNQVARPGVLGVDARADVMHPAFAYPGAMGVFGTFHTDNAPTVDLLVDLADNEAQVVDLFVRQAGRR